MILILGGAYQGKMDFSKGKFHLSDEEIFTCTDTHIDLSKRCIYKLEEFTFSCIYKLEEFTFSCVQAGLDPLEQFKKLDFQQNNIIFICQDIFCGVVPMERNLRLWRDATGKLCQHLAGEAEAVYRIYCGLEQRLK